MEQSRGRQVGQQQGNPAYWRRWLREQGLTAAVERQVNEFYRSLRGALERMWTFAFAGGVAGALIGSLLAVLYLGRTSEARLPLLKVALVVIGAAAAAAVAWWVAYVLVHRTPLKGRSRLSEAGGLQHEDTYIERVLETVADGLSRSNLQPGDSRIDLGQLTQSTVVTGLREAPTAELERHLLERLVGSAFVATAGGGVFVFKPGPPCVRCDARTRTGPLRLLNVPAHWAAENGYQRLKELPARGRLLPVEPARTQDLEGFLGKSASGTSGTYFFGPRTELLLCEVCGKEAIRLGLVRDPEAHRRVS